MRYLALWIGALCVLAFAAQAIVPGFTEAFLLRSDRAAQEPWRLLTAVFLHGGIAHLLLNLFALFLFGLILEREVGSRDFLAVFFIAGIIASFASLFFYERSLGASGAIFGVMGMLAIMRPTMTVYVSYIPMPMILAVFVWALIDLMGFIVPSNVANAAHLAGLGVGLLAGLAYRLLHPPPKATKRPHDEHLDKELDRYELRWGLR